MCDCGDTFKLQIYLRTRGRRYTTKSNGEDKRVKHDEYYSVFVCLKTNVGGEGSGCRRVEYPEDTMWFVRGMITGNRNNVWGVDEGIGVEVATRWVALSQQCFPLYSRSSSIRKLPRHERRDTNIAYG